MKLLLLHFYPLSYPKLPSAYAEQPSALGVGSLQKKGRAVHVVDGEPAGSLGRPRASGLPYIDDLKTVAHLNQKASPQISQPHEPGQMQRGGPGKWSVLTARPVTSQRKQVCAARACSEDSAHQGGWA